MIQGDSFTRKVVIGLQLVALNVYGMTKKKFSYKKTSREQQTLKEDKLRYVLIH